ncbi:SurA N-terminal domain-containing protein, partial [Bacteroidales bacterium OttesenSCG-928-M11]|nr:SurA N-terminal domain-containing protein [Bacteroidales bacterium OttesenSCG-928-M11]
DIGVNEFQTLFERYLENAKAQNPEGTISEIQENQIRNDVLNSLISQKITESLTSTVGFAVGEDELTDLFLGNNVSPIIQYHFSNPNTGVVDKDAIRNFIIAMEDDTDYSNDPQAAYDHALQKAQWVELSDQVKLQQISSKLNSFLSSAIVYNSIDRKALHEKNKVKVDFDYVSKLYSTIPDEGIEVSDAEIKNLYNKKKNLYPQEDAKVIDYIRVQLTPSQNDIMAEREKLMEVKTQLENPERVAALVSHTSIIPYKAGYRSYSSLTSEEKRVVDNNSIGTITNPTLSGVYLSMYKFEDKKSAPDSVTFSILPLGSAVNGVDLTAKADSLTKEIKAKSFAEVAKVEYGGQFDGSYGTHTEQSLLESENGFFTVAFKDALFNAPLNEPVMISMDMKGTFLVQVTEKTKPVDKYKVASIRKEVRASRETRNEAYNNLSRYISEHQDLQSFRDSASVAGYTVYQDVQVTKSTTNISGVEYTRQIVQWAFNNEKGAVSNIFETQDYNNLIVAAVRDFYPEGNQPVELVQETLKREIINQKKGEKLVAELNGKKVSDMQQAAEALNSTPSSVKDVSFGLESRIANIGNEPIIYAEAPLAPVGEVSKLLTGKSGVYLLYVTDKRANDEEYNDELMKAQTEMQNQMRLRSIFSNSKFLESNHKIENNSINFPIYR